MLCVQNHSNLQMNAKVKIISVYQLIENLSQGLCIRAQVL